MLQRICFWLFVLLILAVSQPCLAQDEQAQDAEGCKDSPLVARFPGSHINRCENKEFEQAKIPVAKDADGNAVEKDMEGEYHYWDMGNRDGLSDVQEIGRASCRERV